MTASSHTNQARPILHDGLLIGGNWVRDTSAGRSAPSTSGDHTPVYTGPIFDGATHLYKVPDAFSRYLPAQFKKDWSIEWK